MYLYSIVLVTFGGHTLRVQEWLNKEGERRGRDAKNRKGKKKGNGGGRREGSRDGLGRRKEGKIEGKKEGRKGRKVGKGQEGGMRVRENERGNVGEEGIRRKGMKGGRNEG
jgi:hypothetical protein